MKKENENRGAALVTVLIAVTFMAVLASSLIYMAYMNYLTKAMRYAATDDFYTDEFALDELATTLQQRAADTSSFSDGKAAIRSAVGEYTVGSYTAYTEASVAGLITTASQDATITVATSDRLKDDMGNLTEDSLIVEDEYIKLVGVQITATTAEGYTSTITSDITIYFPSTLPGTLDINDFSIITESRIDMSNGGSRVYSGNMFVQNNGSSQPALTIGNNGCMVLLSPQAMFDGDIVIGEKSALHITGNCTVYGTITVNSGGALIVSGTLRHSGPVNAASDATLIGVDDTNAQTVNRSPLLDSGVLTEQIFETVQIYGYPTDSGVGASAFREVSFEDICTRGTGNVQYSDSTSVGGEDAWAYVYGIGQGNNIQSCSNALVMFCHDVNISSSMNFDHTTLLTSGLISYNNTQGTAYMTKMSDEAYEAAKDLLFYMGTAGSETQFSVDGGGYDMNFKAAFASGTMSDYTSVRNGAASDHKSPDADGERVYVIDTSNVNYLPIRYFINKDASSIISQIFAAPVGGPDQTNSMVIYEVWSKD